MNASVVFSIDFELRWGVADVFGTDLSAYRENLEGVREAVPRLLELFARQGVHATWATVAAVALGSWEEYLTYAPSPPRYLAPRVAPPRELSALDPGGRLHFAPDLVELVARAPGQELGSHSFSHYFFGEPGFVRRDAIADAKAVAALFERKFGMPPRSFVFPRNQIGFVDVLEQHGLRRVRTNPDAAAWNAPIGVRNWGPLRAMRFAESFFGVRPASRVGTALPASGFLRLGLPDALFRAHRRAVSHAASRLREHEFLHLWFHPHNLGDAPTQRVARLASVLSAISDATHGGVRFLSMAET